MSHVNVTWEFAIIIEETLYNYEGLIKFINIISLDD